MPSRPCRRSCMCLNAISTTSRNRAAFSRSPWASAKTLAQGERLNGVSMEIKRGIPVSPGVAIGSALVVETEGIRIPRRFIDKLQGEEEIERLHQGLKAAVADAHANKEAINEKLGKQYGAIFAAHAMLIEDPE